ncbi:MAG: hypothetical protein Q8R88_10125 [Desulfoprunum sp.]|nr:hypothetical protein [Desulfoprunum sp.]
MALTLRLTETENALLEKIAVDLNEKTQSGASKMMIASWIARKRDLSNLQVHNMEFQARLIQIPSPLPLYESSRKENA